MTLVFLPALTLLHKCWFGVTVENNGKEEYICTLGLDLKKTGTGIRIEVWSHQKQYTKAE